METPQKQMVNKILSNGDKTKKRQRHVDDRVHIVCIITHDKLTSDIKDELQIHRNFFFSLIRGFYIAIQWQHIPT